MNDKDLLFSVFAQLERERAVSIPQLSQLLGMDKENIWRALQTLVFSYDKIGMRLELQNSYAVLEGGSAEEVLRLTPHETAVLIDVLTAQGYPSDSGLVAKLADAKGAANADDDAPPCFFASTPSGNVAPVLETLAASCEDVEHHLLRIEYLKEGAAQVQMRIVEPWTISSDGDWRYLHAWCRTAVGWRSFRIDRIKSATVLEECFEPHADAPEALNLRGADTQMAKIRFAPGTALPDWPALSSATVNDDGSTDARVPWVGTAWLPQHIVAQFGTALPLSPPELVTATRRAALQMQETLGA